VLVSVSAIALRSLPFFACPILNVIYGVDVSVPTFLHICRHL